MGEKECVSETLVRSLISAVGQTNTASLEAASHYEKAANSFKNTIIALIMAILFLAVAGLATINSMYGEMADLVGSMEIVIEEEPGYEFSQDSNDGSIKQGNITFGD